MCLGGNCRIVLYFISWHFVTNSHIYTPCPHLECFLKCVCLFSYTARLCMEIVVRRRPRDWCYVFKINSLCFLLCNWEDLLVAVFSNKVFNCDVSTLVFLKPKHPQTALLHNNFPIYFLFKIMAIFMSRERHWDRRISDNQRHISLNLILLK